MTKKLISFLLIFLCLCTCLAPFNVIWADEITANIAFSTSTVDVDQTVTVTLHFTSDTANFSKVDGYLMYDSSVIEFVPQNEADGGGGNLHIVGTSTDLTDSLTITLTFRALKEGSSVFSLRNCQLLDESGVSVGSPSAESKTITVKNTSSLLSSNANLSSLTGPGTWTPEFSPEITEYQITVDYSITNFLVTAEQEDSKASIELTGSQSLQVGSNNQRKVIVTAQDGTQKTYTLKITRQAAPETGAPDSTTPPPTQTQKPTPTPDHTQIQWGTPAQDITDAPDATVTAEATPTPAVTVAPTPSTSANTGMSVNDLKNAMLTVIVIVAIIIIVVLFTIVYCMQQKDKKKHGNSKGKRK